MPHVKEAKIMTVISLLDDKESKETKSFSHECLKEGLDREHYSYVLITCSKPNLQGKMEVEFSYGGDEATVSYLLEGAKQAVDSAENSSIDFS